MTDDLPGRPPAYRIETERLVLRPWAPDDVPALRALVVRNHEHLRPWFPWAQTPPTLDEQLAVVRGFRARYDSDSNYVLGMFLDGAPIGGTGLDPGAGPRALEVGYWVDAGHQGRGLVTEAVAALCRLAFEVMGIERLDLHCDPRNVRSAAVAQRLGFTDEGVRRRRVVGVDGQLRDTRNFTLLRDELAASPAASARVQAWDALGRRLL